MPTLTPGWLAARTRLIGLVLTMGPTVIAQPPVRPTAGMVRLERVIQDRIRALGQKAGAMTPERFVLRIPMSGDPASVTPDGIDLSTDTLVGAGDEGWGALLDTAVAHARDASTIAAGTFELSDSSGNAGLYHVRMEDRSGRCIEIRQQLRLGDDGRVVTGARTVSACPTLIMADVRRRAQRLGRFPLRAGRLSDDWAVRVVGAGVVDVYRDSVVVRLASLQAHTDPAQTPKQVDSISVGLALGHARSWSVARQSAARPVGRTVAPGREWRRTWLRFTVPVDSTFPLRDAWPVIQGHLHVAPSADNPQGIAWVYAHAPEGFFAGLTWPAP